jgi:DNA repair exonuclease SbcCD ATPase subunit
MPTSKPTNIDAQRILAIMDELKEKLTYLSVVTPQVLEGLQSEEGQAACELLGPELMKQFQEQIRLEELYVVANQASDGYGHDGDNEDVREDVKSLQKNTLELCRRMKATTNIVQELRNHQETRPAQMVQFLKTLVDMQELTLKRLTTTVEEERSKVELLGHYQNKEQDASKRRQQLEKDLNHIRREKDRSQSHRTEILTKLKADLLDVKENKLSRMNSLRTRYENRMKEYQDQFNARKEEMEKRIAQLKDRNKKLRDESQEDEVVKKKAVRRYETDLKNEIEKYDTAIKEMSYHLNENQEGFRKEQKQLMELREHFSKVDSEKECISNEEGLSDARKAKLEYEKSRKIEASALVQAFWRGIIQREQYQIMKKNKKKKGKPGKKGK